LNDAVERHAGARAPAPRVRIAARQHDHRRARVSPPDRRDQLAHVEPSQVFRDDEDIGRGFNEDLRERERIARGSDGRVRQLPLEDQARERPVVRIRVDEQDAGSRGHGMRLPVAEYSDTRHSCWGQQRW
jgi:hypothetical protein